MSIQHCIYMYNAIDINKIDFDNKPYKRVKKINVTNEESGCGFKSIHYVDISYLKGPLYIQLPCCKLKHMEDDIIELIIDLDLYKFIKRLESYIVNKVYENSEVWFLGKIFTMNKIINSIVSNVNKDDDYYLTLVLSKNVMLYDSYKNVMTLEKFKELNNQRICKENKDFDVVCIIKISGLQFIDNKFICNLVIEQIKVIKDTKIDCYSIIESESESETKSNQLTDEYFFN